MISPTASPRAVILDLDGTLVESGEEICRALNAAFAELGLPELSLAAVQSFVGRGVGVLVERALKHVEAKGIDARDAIARFEKHYGKIVGTEAQLFPGVLNGLCMLCAAGHPLAVVTNKPRSFTERLLERLNLAPLFSALVAGDDGVRNKPSGDMVKAACRKLGVETGSALFIGDSANDVAAARDAGCEVWCVPYGYNEGRPAGELACDRIVATVEEAARLLLRRAS